MSTIDTSPETTEPLCVNAGHSLRQSVVPVYKRTGFPGLPREKAYDLLIIHCDHCPLYVEHRLDRLHDEAGGHPFLEEGGT